MAKCICGCTLFFIYHNNKNITKGYLHEMQESEKTCIAHSFFIPFHPYNFLFYL